MTGIKLPEEFSSESLPNLPEVVMSKPPPKSSARKPPPPQPDAEEEEGEEEEEDHSDTENGSRTLRRSVSSQDDQGERSRGTQTAEERRQVHILSEQKRRANINEGFEHVRAVLPLQTARKASKSKLLQTSVQYIEMLANTRDELISELQQARHLNSVTLQ